MLNFFSKKTTIQAFTFGEPEPVLNAHDLIDHYLSGHFNGQYYELPIAPQHLYKCQYASPHHASALQLKINCLCDLFVPSKYLSLNQFRHFATSAMVLGNAYLEEIPSRSIKTPYGFNVPPAMYVRRDKDLNYVQMTEGEVSATPFTSKIHHWREFDLRQEIYGKPYYLAALQAAWLNEESTLFRRYYYKNGNQAGFILYLSDPGHNPKDVEDLKAHLKETKGPGAFRNMFFYAPKGKKDGIQVIPVESAQAHDKFFEIKNTSRDDIMAMHRIPPNLIAVQSTNAGGFGRILDAREAFIKNEIVPYAKLLTELHEVLQFDFKAGTK